MALRRLVQSQSTKILLSVPSTTLCDRRRVSGQLQEKFSKVYGSPEGISVDTVLQVIPSARIFK